LFPLKGKAGLAACAAYQKGLGRKIKMCLPDRAKVVRKLLVRYHDMRLILTAMFSAACQGRLYGDSNMTNTMNVQEEV
jgi:hypothetical protein